MSNQEERFERLVQRVWPDGKLLQTWRLTGGISAQVTGVEISLSHGRKKKVIVRHYGKTDLKRNPRVAAHESRLLRILQSAGLAAPAPYYLDEFTEIFPTPYIVVAYIDGEPEFNPPNLNDFIRQLAAHLSKLHTLKVESSDLSFLPSQESVYTKKLAHRPARLDESLSEGRIREVLEPVWPLPQRNKPALLHGDFWPGNILWKNGQLIAIVDWEDAALGDPLADVANARLEVLWAFGLEAMKGFTDCYKALMPSTDFSDLPYWDLGAALRPASQMSNWGLPENTLRTMQERHKTFVDQAVESMDARTAEFPE